MTMTPRQLIAKRVIDLFVAGSAVAVLLPLIVGVAAAVRMSGPGPVLFVQTRSGLNGRPFRVYKFRTMSPVGTVRAEREVREVDPRITPVGRLLRRTGLDELPQLLNVLRGEMSVVGPRPLVPWENDLCDARERTRLDMKPGMTGLSLVNGRNRIPWHQRVAWDVTYVETASLTLDLQICLRTVMVILTGRDAYLAAPEQRVAPAESVIDDGATGTAA
jgi:lipopolysaccharide/colanic/teichoic acid biosynthesis glycosyltransferase